MSISSWNAGIIRPVPVAPTGPYEYGAAPGVWTLDQVAFWTQQGLWPLAGNFPKDAQFNYVTMLLHGDGTNGAQNNTFLDSSTNNFTITRNGNTTQGSFSPYGSNWSNYFDGTSAYLDSSSSAAQFGTGSFTVEFWVYPTVATAAALVDFRSTSTAIFGQIYFASDRTIHFYLPTDIATSNTLTLNSWNHVAISRQSNTLKMFINGVSGYSATNSSNYNASGLRIAAGINGGNLLTGNLSNLRIIVGTGIYTTDFTPPTAPLTAVSGTTLLTCQSNRFIDNSTNAYAITATGTPSVQRFNPFGASTAYSTSVIGGSGYFDGSGDYLNFPNNTAFDFSTGDFTVEAWVYRVGTGTGTQIYESIIGGNTSGTAYWNMYVNSSNNTIVWFGNDSTLRTTSTTITNNTWNHVAVSRSSGTLKIFINGVQGYSASVSTAYSLGSSGGNVGFDIGSTGNKYFYGYISNCRVVKGTALYTSAFTPPTEPLTAITNTSLLTNFTNGAIFDNAMMNDLETLGNAQISTSVVKYGTGSMYFDGTGDYLINASNRDVSWGTGNFTIEGWFYWNSLASESAIMSGNGVGWTFYIYPANKLQWGTTTPQASANLLTGSTTLVTGQWYHIAVTRSSNTLTLWVNGVSDGTVTDSNNYSASGRLAIGLSHSFNYFNGYIDDLRITKGYARYTSNFTPPTAAFPNTGPN